ncbi:MAG: DUF2384 domain-containing protein [Gammaproteobacteria bacterium]|nr:DUF2384 domain-containing protein [Gammaproteobacteria bacterium]
MPTTPKNNALFDEVREFAVSVFEDPDKAELWLNSDLPILGGQKPIALLNNSAGLSLVIQLLKKIQDGEFS